MPEPRKAPYRGRIVLAVAVACFLVTLLASAMHVSDRWTTAINTLIAAIGVAWVVVDERRRRHPNPAH